MDYKRILGIGLALLGMAAAFVSCKDDDDDSSVSTSNYFSGAPTFTIPQFIQQGETYTLTPEKVERTSDDESTESYGVIWKVSPIMSAADTVRFAGEDESLYPDTFTFTVPDTLCTLTITCSAYASGYYNTSASAVSFIIDPSEVDGSLTGLSYPDPDTKFTDSRDAAEYRYVTIGNLDWMARNLAWDEAGHSYNDSEVMDSLFGRLYTWTEASSACPSGWRLPSNDDWLALANAVNGGLDSDALGVLHSVNGAIRAGEAYLNELRLWEYQPSFEVNNSTYMNVLPVGYATVTGDAFNFKGVQEYSMFWTSDAKDADDAYYRYSHKDSNNMLLGFSSKDYFAATVRCCRDH